MVLIFLFIFIFLPQSSNCGEKILEGFSPMEICAGEKNLDEFLARFELSKVNKIILKQVILEGDEPFKRDTLATIKNKEKVEWIISAINKSQCYKSLLLGYCSTELWLYEDNKLRLKIALNINKTDAIVNFYMPNDIPYMHNSLGKGGTFMLVDKKLCSWLLELVKRSRVRPSFFTD